MMRAIMCASDFDIDSETTFFSAPDQPLATKPLTWNPEAVDSFAGCLLSHFCPM
jgi:hypothetical protein